MKADSKQITVIAIPLLAFVIMSTSYGVAYAHTMDVAGDYKLEIGWDDEPPIQGIENAIEVVITHATEADKKQAEEMRKMMGMDSQMNMGSMNMAQSSMSGYEEKIIPILGQFDSKKITSSDAINQIAKIIDSEKPSDYTGKEIKSLIADSRSGIMTSDDAIYAMIGMLGTELPTETNHEQTMTHTDRTHNEDQEEGISGLEDTIQVAVTLHGQTSTLNVDKTNVGGIYQAKFMPPSPGFTVVHISGMIHDTKVNLDMHPEEIESLSILSPLKQVEHGIDPSNVQCKKGLELFMRTYEDSAICVSSDLGQKLMELGVADYF
jgi:hypothetical protein